MREIVVLSGKGGAGKTSITAAFAHQAAGRVLLADLDVDASNLHLVLSSAVVHTEDFISGHVAVLDSQKCTDCGLCHEVCRFGAILRTAAGGYMVDPGHCEGCKVCVVVCPQEAIAFTPRFCGQWMRSQTRFGPLVHARLLPGGENSGRLVSLVRSQARQWAASLGLDLILADGAPGIGCPVIASLSGASLAVVVVEPTPSGLHDAMRAAEVCQRFRVPVATVINKWDVAPSLAEEVEAVSQQQGWVVIGRLPHHRAVAEAMSHGLAVTEWDARFVADVGAMWQRIEQMLAQGVRL